MDKYVNVNSNTLAQDDLEINFKEIFNAVIARYKLIALMAVVVAFCALLISAFVITPKYQARITMVINSVSDVTNGFRSDDVTASISLVPTYIELVKSNNVLGDVAAKTQDLGYEAADIADMLSITSTEETQIIEIGVTNSDPEHANIIANAIASIVPDKIVDLMEATSVKVVDASTVPDAPISPNVKKNTAIGFVVGALLGIAIATLIALLDNSIKDESDIAAMYPGLPVLGVLPKFTAKESKPDVDNNEETVKE